MTILNKTKFLEFKSTQSPSGKDWYYVRRTNDTPMHDSAVVITTIVKKDDKYHFLLMLNSRPPLTAENKAKYCLESPAGLIGDEDTQENLLECAKKELLEETGLVADELFIELENCSTSAGLSCETLSYVTAIVNNYKIHQKPVSDGGIILDRFLIPIEELHNYLKSVDTKETSIAAATICGLYYAIQRLKILTKTN